MSSILRIVIAASVAICLGHECACDIRSVCSCPRAFRCRLRTTTDRRDTYREGQLIANLRSHRLASFILPTVQLIAIYGHLPSTKPATRSHSRSLLADQRRLTPTLCVAHAHPQYMHSNSAIIELSCSSCSRGELKCSVELVRGHICLQVLIWLLLDRGYIHHKRPILAG